MKSAWPILTSRTAINKIRGNKPITPRLTPLKTVIKVSNRIFAPLFYRICLQLK